MELFIVSFVAGILTVLSPCILPLLPVLLGGTLQDNKKDVDTWKRPLVITASLGVSVIVFTLLLKATTALLGVPVFVWQVISGLILVLLGLSFLFPKLWDAFALKTNIASRSQKLLVRGGSHPRLSKDVFTGIALGPVFNSCSPTYLLIVATILPATFGRGVAYLLAYTLGLCGILLMIAFAGQSLVNRISWLSNAEGRFRKFIGVVFIIVGFAIIFGLDKKFQTFVLDQGWYDPISNFEKSL